MNKALVKALTHWLGIKEVLVRKNVQRPFQNYVEVRVH
jgi:hypothetical protein